MNLAISKFQAYRTSRWPDKVLGLLFMIFVFRSAFQFFSGRSLWLDEAFLALNLISKDPIQLLHPLDYAVVAPALFIELEKVFSLIIPNSDYGLRLLSLLAYWGVLYFFLKTLRLVTHHPVAQVFGFSLIGWHFQLFMYSNELKQYIFDVLVAISLIYYFLKPDLEGKRVRVFMIWGSASIFLSTIGPIILFAIGACSLHGIWRKELSVNKYLPLFMVWTVLIGVNFFLFYFNHPSQSVMKLYWETYKGGTFMPIHSFTGSVNFIAGNVQSLLFDFFDWGPAGPHILAYFILVGLIFILQRKPLLAGLLTLPIAVHFLISGFQFYPAVGRLTLYFAPIFALLAALGLEATDWGIRRIKIAVPARITNSLLSFNWLFAVLIPVAIYLGTSFYRSHPLPLKVAEIKDCLRYIENKHKVGDQIYVYVPGQYAFKYYSETKFISADIPFTIGKDDISRAAIVQEMCALRDRTWLLFSTISAEDNAYYIHAIDSAGFKKLDSLKAVGSSTYLYDFRRIVH